MATSQPHNETYSKMDYRAAMFNMTGINLILECLLQIAMPSIVCMEENVKDLINKYS